MKFAATIEYRPDKEKLAAIRPKHRQYLRSILESGRLYAAGPFTEDAGAMWIFEAETVAQAEETIQGDPLHAAGLFKEWRLHPLAYWSAQEMKA